MSAVDGTSAGLSDSLMAQEYKKPNKEWEAYRMAETWNGVPVRYDLLPIGTRRNGEALHTKMESLVCSYS